MAAPSQVQFGVEQGFLTPKAPKAEARALLEIMRQTGETADDIRELILVPPEIQGLFHSYALEHPEEFHAIEQVLDFRRRVGEEFERLVERGDSIPEVQSARDRLTPRECEVLQLISEGKNCREIGAELSISVKTAETHRANVAKKLSRRDRSDLFAHGLDSTLI